MSIFLISLGFLLLVMAGELLPKKQTRIYKLLALLRVYLNRQSVRDLSALRNKYIQQIKEIKRHV